VHPFDDPSVVAGQGTAGLEICRRLGVEVVLVGGLRCLRR
jgi:threonine dehydratase